MKGRLAAVMLAAHDAAWDVAVENANTTSIVGRREIGAEACDVSF